jgi:ABC-type nitrate/sulfonate/bicarbonate transport system substrate-binding protein
MTMTKVGNQNIGPLADEAKLPSTIWFTRCPVPTASGIAIQKGWLQAEFSEQGIAVRSLRHSQDPKIRVSHYIHTVPDSFRQGGNAPAIFARSEGKDTVLLGLHWIPQYQAIIALPESQLTRVEQLRGKRLALPRRVNDQIDFWRATALQGYHNALRLHGLSLADVELVDLPVETSYVDEDVAITDTLTPAPRLIKYQTREMTALLRGEVDAMFAYSVWGASVRSQLGAIEIVNLAEQPGLDAQINNGIPETLTVSGRLLRNHPDLVERYVAQLIRAANWAAHNEDAVRRAMAIETGTAEYWLNQGIGPDVGKQLAISLDETLVSALEVRKNFLLEHGFIRHDFDIRAWIDPQPLRNAQTRARGMASIPD